MSSHRGSILSDEGRQKISELSYQIFHGEDSDFTPKSSNPKEIELELHNIVVDEGFDYPRPGNDTIGSARRPYIVPKSLQTDSGRYVVKFARYKNAGRFSPEAGLLQNSNEVNVWELIDKTQKQFFVPVRDYDPNYFWLIMEYAEKFKNDNASSEPKYSPDEASKLNDEMTEAGVRVSDMYDDLGYHEGELKCLDYGESVSWCDNSQSHEVYDCSETQIADRPHDL